MKYKKINCFILPLLIASIFSISSCGKLLNATFTKTFSNITFEIDTTSTVGNVTFAGENINTDISNFAASNNFSLSKIKSAKLKSCTLTINDISTIQPPITFNILDSVFGKLSGVGLNPIEVSNTSILPNSNATTLNLNVRDVDVMPYIKADSFNYIISGRTNAPIPHKVQMTASVTFEIVAGL